MARRMMPFLLFCGAMWGCGGPTLCECEIEAQKSDPNTEIMADCAELYAGKSFEEIEAELGECGTD